MLGVTFSVLCSFRWTPRLRPSTTGTNKGATFHLEKRRPRCSAVECWVELSFSLEERRVSMDSLEQPPVGRQPTLTDVGKPPCGQSVVRYGHATPAQIFIWSAAGSELWEIRKPGRYAMVKRYAPPWCADLTRGVGGSVVNQCGAVTQGVVAVLIGGGWAYAIFSVTICRRV